MAEESAVASETTNTPEPAQGSENQSAGLDTQKSQQAAAEGAEAEVKTGETGETKTQEPDVTGKEDKKQSFEERVQALTEKRIKELEANFEAKLKAQQVPEVSPPDVEAQVEENILRAESRLAEIFEEIRLLDGEPVPAALKEERQRIRQWIEGAEKALAENRQKREALEKQQQAANVIKAMDARIAQAAPMVMQSLNVTQEQWETGEKFFVEQRKSNPALDTEYRERVFTDGPFRALKWAAEYVMKEMGEQAEANNRKKEEGKQKTVTGDGGGSAVSGDFAKVKNWSDLMKLPSSDINRFAAEHPKRFEEMNNRRK